MEEGFGDERTDYLHRNFPKILTPTDVVDGLKHMIRDVDIHSFESQKRLIEEDQWVKILKVLRVAHKEAKDITDKWVHHDL